MADLLLHAVAVLFQPLNLLILVAAVVGGTLAGAAPGLTSTMAIGLLVPITFTMPTESALILLFGVYCGGLYGGAITAILLNIPGSPTSVVTALDGYPMTRQGEGGKAIAIATLSSTLGGIISCVVLIFLSLQLSRLVIYFGSPEYMALGIFASAVVFSLSGDSVLKGFIAVCIGFLIATIGIDPTAMHPRFTFGITEIQIGIPEIPAIIGLFCVSEAFRMVDQATGKPIAQKAVSGLRSAIGLLPRLWPTITKSGLIGCFVGILPGIGALAASYLAYAEARRSSRHPERFGKGAPEGVAASEAANNGVTGGAMVPVLSFGIPGDTNTLLILGAMAIQGIAPGPALFRENQDIVFLIFGSLILANLLLLPVGLMLARYIAKAAVIPVRYLLPTVAVLAITGASIGYGHIYYFWISIIFGLLGYVLQRGGFPLLPVAMALILGPMVERNLRSSLMLPDASVEMFLTRPVCAALLVMSVVVVVVRLVGARRLRAAEARTEPGPGA
ncbi:tripartite tricarboxylate transporter permease [Acuticoccus sp. M5D2P5]|uniref:tripartite tricarboxylate transporter permease n=1 Tax=Acuticoccus kalidii TaxID=2910977 RepID=UPI001F45F5D0|nr:tripartite tricarboxylate transporter permease [Acuticoccus kalidii]MCF3933395.1 tripartite tricarboxylate transporter permease [Acuticoccus kalidii]